jgi:TM2 domain-containing membrane protein YozV
MSAIIPGSGKIYAGQLGQGIAAFLQNAIFGLQAYEGLQKDGIKSPRFIIYGGLFTLFYIGNVWGSALSVQIKRREFNEKVDEQIIFDMHIPLRTIFN